MNTNTKKIQDKLNKLMKLRDGALDIGSQHEAEAASQKIQKLLLDYNLEEADIKQTDPDDIDFTDIPTSKFEELGWKKTDASWKENLLNTLCIHNMCVCVITNIFKYNNSGTRVKTAPRMKIFGKDINRQTVVYLWEQLVPKIDKMGKDRFKAFSNEIYEKKNTFLRGYYSGVRIGIDIGLHKQVKEMKLEHAKLGELMDISKTLVTQAMQNHFASQGGLSKGRRSTGLSGRDGQAMGIKDGKSMQVDQKGGPKNSLRLS